MTQRSEEQKNSLSSLLRDERGAFVEYMIVVGLIALIAIAGFTTFGKSVQDKIDAQAKTVGTIGGK